MLMLLGAALLRLRDASKDLLDSLYCIVQVSLPAVSDILHNIELLRQLRDLFVHLLALFQLLLA